MARVYVSIGSNVDRELRIRQSIEALRARFGELELSPVYDSAAVGFDGSNFLNLVAGLETGEGVVEVAAAFREIEERLGRDRNQPKFSSRPIDLDIRLYDELVMNVPGVRIPRPEILENAFVLRPLQDIAPGRIHPQAGRSYAELWQAMAPNAPRLDRVDLPL